MQVGTRPMYELMNCIFRKRSTREMGIQGLTTMEKVISMASCRVSDSRKKKTFCTSLRLRVKIGESGKRPGEKTSASKILHKEFPAMENTPKPISRDLKESIFFK